MLQTGGYKIEDTTFGMSFLMQFSLLLLLEEVFTDEIYLRKIPVVSEYGYLGVILDTSQTYFNFIWKRSKNDLISYVPTCVTILKIFHLRISTCCGQQVL
jgi:hypothetical protein